MSWMGAKAIEVEMGAYGGGCAKATVLVGTAPWLAAPEKGMSSWERQILREESKAEIAARGFNKAGAPTACAGKDL